VSARKGTPLADLRRLVEDVEDLLRRSREGEDVPAETVRAARSRVDEYLARPDAPAGLRDAFERRLAAGRPN
jgi:hypothetical protein